MKEEQKKLKRQLIVLFWINLLIFICLTFYLLFKVGIKGRAETELDFMWERLSIIITILIIPLSLKLFHSNYKKIVETDLPIFLKKLKKYYILRMITIDVVAIINLLGFYVIGSLNFLYMGIIALLVFAFCYPTESMIDPMLKENNEIENSK